jgi:phytoene synthase
MIRVGSKSFSLASRLFDREKRSGAVRVYGWCRYSDDRIDECRSKEEVEVRLQELQRHTRHLYEGKISLELSPVEKDIFLAFGSILSERKIPATYPLELLEGMAMDARGETYPTYQKLKLYCFRVAGTVGLMMSHVMGLRTSEALDQAVDLGLAMQLTNIARDVREDFEMGRVYLPEEWLAEEGLSARDVMALNHQQAVYRVVARLLQEAERFYQSGLQGVISLPLRAAFAVQAAALIYREIGRSILAQGPAALQKRTVVPLSRKLVLLLIAVFQVLSSIPARLRDPRGFGTPTRVWFFHGREQSTVALSR